MLREGRRVVKRRRGILDPRERFLPRGGRGGGHQAGALLRSGFGARHDISYKGSPTNLVTEMDRGRGGAHRRRHPAPRSRTRGPRRGERRARRGRAAPLDRGSARRHHQLRPRDADLLRVDRARDRTGELALGVLYDPSRDECFVAERGRGATLNGAPLASRRRPTLGESLLGTGYPYDIRAAPRNNLAEHAALILRSAACARWARPRSDLACVAAGRLDGYWELAAGRLGRRGGRAADREAGGRVTASPQRRPARPGGAHHRGLQRLHPRRDARSPQGGRGHAMTDETKTPPVHVRTIRVEVARAGEHELEITATLVDERPARQPALVRRRAAAGDPRHAARPARAPSRPGDHGGAQRDGLASLHDLSGRPAAAPAARRPLHLARLHARGQRALRPAARLRPLHRADPRGRPGGAPGRGRRLRGRRAARRGARRGSSTPARPGARTARCTG